MGSPFEKGLVAFFSCGFQQKNATTPFSIGEYMKGMISFFFHLTNV